MDDEVGGPLELTPTPPPAALDAVIDGVNERATRPRSRVLTWGFGLLMSAAAVFGFRLGSDTGGRETWSSRMSRSALGSMAGDWAQAALVRTGTSKPRADRALDRTRQYTIRGGVLMVPDSFASADGTFDLVIHFHGNVAVVKESLEVAGVNALLAIVNVGLGSGAYEHALDGPGAYEALLDEIRETAENRGLEDAKIGRVALSAWSAGYGAVGRILRYRKGIDRLDAVLIEDGIHSDWDEDDPSQPNRHQMQPYLAFAERAKRGEVLFSMTHSEIVPGGNYASTTQTASYLLEHLGAQPRAASPSSDPKHLWLKSMDEAVSRKKERPLAATTDNRLGNVHIRGFEGETKEDHMSHLFQMASTVIGELAARWDDASAPSSNADALGIRTRRGITPR